jgi:hypothetical protein
VTLASFAYCQEETIVDEVALTQSSATTPSRSSAMAESRTPKGTCPYPETPRDGILSRSIVFSGGAFNVITVSVGRNAHLETNNKGPKEPPWRLTNPETPTVYPSKFSHPVFAPQLSLPTNILIYPDPLMFTPFAELSYLYLTPPISGHNSAASASID